VNSSELWLSSFALLPFGAVLTSWFQLTDPSIFERTEESRANARFSGDSFDFAGYKMEHIAALAADASYHSADAQSGSDWSASDCLECVTKAADAFLSEPPSDTDQDFKPFSGERAFWQSVTADCDWLNDKNYTEHASGELTRMLLWPSAQPTNWYRGWGVLVHQLRSLDPNYSVWIDWYERRIRGERAAFDIPGDKGRIEDKKILRRLAEATDEDFWGKGHEYVNATLKGWLDEAREKVRPRAQTMDLFAGPPEIGSATVAQIAATLQNQASPQAQIIDGKLDAAPNTVFDKPQYSDNLANLPSELLAFTEVILNSLPRNCQPVVRNCFTGFRDEMLVRGNRPILNIVKAMAASLTAELYGAPDPTTSPDEWHLKDPREWGAGIDSMFASFFKAYHDLIHHFPMDVEREEFIANTPIDEFAASGAALTQPVDAVAAMIVDLGKQGFATENIVRIIEAHQLYNRDVSQLPAPDQPTDAITPKRRHVLATAGFYLHTYSVIGSTASIYSLPAFQALLPKLSDAIDALLVFIS
jgi:hypothetical protein